MTQYKTFKCKVEGLEGAIFESGAVKHSAQFTKILKETGRYVQEQYIGNAAKTINDIERRNFEFPAHSVPQIITYPDGLMTQEKIDEMDIYLWKKDYELVLSQKAKFTEKEKRVFPIILDQCSPSWRSQLEEVKMFQETCTKMMLWNC